jgi:diguanylate cyclase (GGDEF)-like protein
MLDVDHFKQINDTHGHRIGDLALQHLVSGIRSCIRQTDLVARFGGDEFAIFMPETDDSRALQVATRIHHFIRSHPVPNLDRNITCTVSVGIASYAAQRDVMSIDALLEQADQALYKAKQAGRNQTYLFNGHKT